MESILFGMAALLLAAGGGAYFFTKKSGSPRTSKLLNQLGLYGDSKNEDHLPFYRWGWHEDEKNRVSAEQMVREAFRKEGLWLNVDDLNFFKAQCERNIKGESIETSEIEKRVEEIAARSDILILWVIEQVRSAIDFAANASQEEAQEILHKADIKSEPDKAQGHLLALELKR